MPKFLIGNAPCSWGTLEFEGTGGEQIGAGRMLDELAETGYTGTELGDWGYMPTDPAALRAELSLVAIRVTGGASCAQAEIAAAQIFHADGLARGGGNPRGSVTGIAFPPGVASGQRVAGLAMIEFVQAHVPADGDELFAIMLGVALTALVVAPGGAHQRRVEPLFRGKALLDFRVARSALQFMLPAAANVATGAMRRSIELGMDFG